MSLLTPLALQNHDVLRALAANTSASKGWTSIKGLADHLGRDGSNLSKSLRAMHEAGLIHQPASWNGLTDEGRQVLAALERAENGAPADPAPPAAADSTAPEGYALLRHDQILPGPLNPRKDFDSDEAQQALSELATSIERDGLLENLVVRPLETPDDTVHQLVAGERRWRAIGVLIEGGTWPDEQLILCKVADLDEAGHRRVALVENLQRRDLKPLEEARALRELIDVTGVSTADIAAEIGFTQRWAQQRLQLLDLSPSLQAQVESGALRLEKARAVLAIWDRLPAIKQAEIERGKLTPEDARQWLDRQPKPLNLPAEDWVLILEIYDRCKTAPAREHGSYTECHADARFSDRAQRLTRWPDILLYDVTHITDGYGDPTGRFQIGAAFDCERQLVVKFGEYVKDPLARERILRDTRREAGIFPPAIGAYSTPWLNAPFEIQPSLRAEIDAERARLVEQREERWKANEKRDAEQRAEAERRKAALAQAIELRATTELATFSPALRGFADSCRQASVALPVHLAPNAAIVDAGGREVLRGWASWETVPDEVHAGRLLIAIALNAAAGLATPDGPPPVDDEEVEGEVEGVDEDDDGQIDLEDAIDDANAVRDEEAEDA